MVKVFLKPSLHKAKSHGSKTYSEATLFPILPVDKLLPSIEKDHYLNRLQDIVALPEDYFSVIYEELINQFALFVQVLPEIYGEELGGLLNDGLRRGLLAIQILHETQEQTPHPLFVFTVFSIALLSDLGYILQYRVLISDEKGNFIEEWYPYLGPMIDFGDFYKLRPYESTPQSLIRGVTPVLARQLLSDTAITWLSSNNQMFDMWLAFLNKGEDWAGGLGKILKIDPKQFEMRMGEINLFPLEIKAFDPLATELGEEFYAWLKKGLLDGTISYNEQDSKVHIFKANELEFSVFAEAPELFRQFCDMYRISRDWSKVLKQFNHLGITKLSGDDVQFEQFFNISSEAKSKKLGFLSKSVLSDKKSGEQAVLSKKATIANSIREGIIIKDAKNIFGSKVPPASKFLKQIDIKWSLDNILPKIRRAILARSQALGFNPKSQK